MSTIDRTVSAMTTLHELTSQLDKNTPSPYRIAGLQSELVWCHWKLGDEQAQRFGAKELKRLRRKLNHSKRHRHYREKGETVADSEQWATQDVAKDHEEEIAILEEVMSLDNLIASVDNAIMHCSMVVSMLKKAEERNPTYSPYHQ